MPVALASKVRTLAVDFGSAAGLAKVDLLELVWANLLRIYDHEAALAWLLGINPLLGDRRPVDLIRRGRTVELMRAIRAERGDTFA